MKPQAMDGFCTFMLLAETRVMSANTAIYSTQKSWEWLDHEKIIIRYKK
jgi:hypothetical protein